MELEKSNRTLNRRNFRNKEAFQHTLGYLNLLCDKYGIRPIFIHAVNFKMELLKTFFLFSKIYYYSLFSYKSISI